MCLYSIMNKEKKNNLDQLIIINRYYQKEKNYINIKMINNINKKWQIYNNKIKYIDIFLT